MAEVAVLARTTAQAAEDMGRGLLRAYHETLDTGVKTAGHRMMATLAEVFSTATPEQVEAATDREALGVDKGTTDAVRLSQTRAVYAVYKFLGADGFTERILSNPAGWTDMMGEVRAIKKGISAEKKHAALVRQSIEAVAVYHPNDPVLASQKAEEWRRLKAEADAIAEAERKADAASPVAIARKLAANLVKLYGAQGALDVADALHDAISQAAAAA